MIISEDGKVTIMGNPIEIYIDTCAIVSGVTDHIDIIKEIIQADEDLYQELIKFNTAVLNIK